MDVNDVLLLMGALHGQTMSQMAKTLSFSTSTVHGRLEKLLAGGINPLLVHPMHGKWYVTERGREYLEYRIASRHRVHSRSGKPGWV